MDRKGLPGFVSKPGRGDQSETGGTKIANSRHNDSADSSGAIQNSPEMEMVARPAGTFTR